MKTTHEIPICWYFFSTATTKQVVAPKGEKFDPVIRWNFFACKAAIVKIQ